MSEVAPFPLSSLSPSSSQHLRPQGELGGGGLVFRLCWAPARSGLHPSVQVSISTSDRPACGVSQALLLCHLGASVPFLPVLTDPGGELLLSTHRGAVSRRGARGSLLQGGKHGCLATQVPLRSSPPRGPLRRRPPTLTQAQGPGVAFEDLHSNRFLNFPARDVTKTASQSRVYFFAQGSF